MNLSSVSQWLKDKNHSLMFIRSTSTQVCGTLGNTFAQFSLVNTDVLEHLVSSYLSTSCVPGLVPGTGRTEEAKSLVQGRDRSSETVMGAGFICEEQSGGWTAQRGVEDKARHQERPPGKAF